MHHTHAPLALPFELIDLVADLIDDRSDLLSMALTCQSLNKHLIPSVLDYREIRAPFEGPYLWNHLAKNTHLARRVRTLRVVTEGYTPKLPKGIEEGGAIHEDGQHEEVFLRATFCTSQLVTFEWSDQRVRGLSFNRVSYDQLWDILVVSCPRLRNLDVCDNVNVLSEDSLVGRSGRLSAVNTLWYCKYTISFCGIRPLWRLSPAFVTNVVAHNPSLRCLDLIVPSLEEHLSPLGDEFGEILLPSLTSFSLYCFTFASPTTLSRFLRLNSTLESVALDSPYSLQSLAKGDLPNLHHFWSKDAQWTSVCLAMPPIWELHCVFDGLEDREVLNAFNSVSSTLKFTYIYWTGYRVHDIENPFPRFGRDVSNALCETLRAIHIEYRGNLNNGYWASRRR
ncbi:hypothetical protein JAAARDRAFT_208367 [Jaapia argillacea MUCL 33604]|uniref:F-box domain-containing protein n=1 Tax=Jaapia argillacea MUCL 33604 TaxID=933084 RepID=A0A067PN14_9AGAM|nr:hypothetical protein JAAARDRAFT_208367 [Jaapia argillacea MUCL 33604]